VGTLVADRRNLLDMIKYGTMAMWRSKKQGKSTMLFRRYISLAIYAFLVMTYNLWMIDMLEQQEERLLLSSNGVDQSSRRDLLEKRRLRAVEEYTLDANNNKIDADMSSFNHRFILFRKLQGQGAGNILNGLLAAHLLGQEFNRTVCVESKYTEFHAAFEAIDPYAMKYCPAFLAENEDIVNATEQHSTRSRLELVNYAPGVPNECSLQERLASPTIKVIEYEGNTYPRWPHVTDSDFFFRHYRARQALLDVLPYDYRHQSPPSTVVHLRAPDGGGGDHRQGLDEDSLEALGEAVPRGNATFLVTNNVDWFKRFEANYGWSHANWSSVAHSAFQNSWELWADWYMLLRAKKVYHTNSDFSNSAVHWMNIDAFVIDGFDTTSRRLILQRESWLRDGETPALSTRTTEVQQEDREPSKGRLLRGCDPK
jgi:hypothetical protein